MSFLVGGALLATGAGASTILAGAGIGAMVGKTLMGGFGAQTKSEAEQQEELAAEMKQEQLGLLGEQKGLAMQAAQSQFAGGQRDVSMGTRTGIRDVKAGGNIAMAQSGLATSGTIESKVKTQTGDLMNKYKSDMTKLFETRDLSKADANLAYRKGEMSAEDAYQNTLSDISAQPTGFLEGMFS